MISNYTSLFCLNNDVIVCISVKTKKCAFQTNPDLYVQGTKYSVSSYVILDDTEFPGSYGSLFYHTI